MWSWQGYSIAAADDLLLPLDPVQMSIHDLDLPCLDSPTSPLQQFEDSPELQAAPTGSIEVSVLHGEAPHGMQIHLRELHPQTLGDWAAPCPEDVANANAAAFPVMAHHTSTIAMQASHVFNQVSSNHYPLSNPGGVKQHMLIVVLSCAHSSQS